MLRGTIVRCIRVGERSKRPSTMKTEAPLTPAPPQQQSQGAPASVGSPAPSFTAMLQNQNVRNAMGVIGMAASVSGNSNVARLLKAAQNATEEKPKAKEQFQEQTTQQTASPDPLYRLERLEERLKGAEIRLRNLENKMNSLSTLLAICFVLLCFVFLVLLK